MEAIQQVLLLPAFWKMCRKIRNCNLMLCILSVQFISPGCLSNWGGNWLDTYFELAPNTNIAALEKKFPAYLKKYMTEDDNWKNYELFLLPFKDVHAGATDIGLDYLNYQKFDKNYTNIFFAIALIVLLIACINFMNLSTARSAERAREVGIRKSIGAHRWQLSAQFISESVILSLIALILAIVLVELFLPYVNNLSQRHLAFPLFTNACAFISVIAGTIVIGVLSGLYPAGYLSSFQPVKVLKGSVQTGKNKGTLRNILGSSSIFKRYLFNDRNHLCCKAIELYAKPRSGF